MPLFKEFDPSRRKFMQNAVMGGLVAEEAVSKIAQAKDEQDVISEGAKLHPSDFIAKNENDLRRAEFGSSFAPEQFGLSLKLLIANPEEYKRRKAYAVGVFQFAVHELGMRHFRLGLRWAEMENAKGEFDPRHAVVFLDEALKEGVDVTLNVGPTKVFRWGEVWVPEKELKSASQEIGLSSIISPNLEFAKRGNDHLLKTMSFLKTHISKEDENHIRAFQPDNEGYHPFGIRNWTTSKETNMQNIDLIHNYFKDTPIVLNSSGPTNMHEIAQTFRELQKRNPEYKSKLVSGVDFHPRREGKPVTLPVVGWMDDFTVSIYKNFGLDVAKQNKQWAENSGFQIKGAEVQMEPYGKEKRPGNSIVELQYVVARLFQKVLPRKEPVEMDGWGIEYFIPRYLSPYRTPDHEAMKNLIQTMNYT